MKEVTWDLLHIVPGPLGNDSSPELPRPQLHGLAGSWSSLSSPGKAGSRAVALIDLSAGCQGLGRGAQSPRSTLTSETASPRPEPAKGHPVGNGKMFLLDAFLPIFKLLVLPQNVLNVETVQG